MKYALLAVVGSVVCYFGAQLMPAQELIVEEEEINMTSTKDFYEKMQKFMTTSEAHFEHNFRVIHKVVHTMMTHHNIWDLDSTEMKTLPKELRNDIRHFGTEFSYHVLGNMKRLATSIMKDMTQQAAILKKRSVLDKSKKLDDKQDTELFKSLLKDQLHAMAMNTQKLRNIKYTLKDM